MFSQLGTFVLGITTKAPVSGWVHSYVHEQSAEKNFKYIDFTTVCDDCKKLDTALMMKCTHREGSDVPWRDNEKMETLKASMTQDAILAEYMGEDDTADSVFDYAQIERMMDSPPANVETNEETVPVYGVFIDPNSGGPCHTAICIARYFQNETVVVCNIIVCDERESAWELHRAVFFHLES